MSLILYFKEPLLMEDYNETDRIDLSDYKIISGQFFRYEKAPFMNIYPKKVSFSNEARGMLNNCQAIRIMFNEKKKTIAIRPMAPSDSNTIIWSNASRKKTYIPQYLCPKLTSHLYGIWGWDKARRYKAFGLLVQYAGRPMIVFDFSNAESYPSTWEGIVNGRK